MNAENRGRRKPIVRGELVLVAHFWSARPARVVDRVGLGSKASLRVVYTDFEDVEEFDEPSRESQTDIVDEASVFRYDETDKYEPEERSAQAYYYRQRLYRSVRQVLQDSPGGLGLDEVVGGDAANMVTDGVRGIWIRRPRQHSPFQMFVWCTMRAEVSPYFESLIVDHFRSLLTTTVRLVVANEPFADSDLLDNNGIVWSIWRSQRDDEALAKAIRIAVMQRQSAMAA